MLRALGFDWIDSSKAWQHPSIDEPGLLVLCSQLCNQPGLNAKLLARQMVMFGIGVHWHQHDNHIVWCPYFSSFRATSQAGLNVICLFRASGMFGHTRGRLAAEIHGKDIKCFWPQRSGPRYWLSHAPRLCLPFLSFACVQLSYFTEFHCWPAWFVCFCG